MAAYCLLGKGVVSNLPGKPLFNPNTDGNVRSSSGEETWRQFPPWKTHAAGWIRNLGVPGFLIGQGKVWGRPGQPGIAPSIPFHAWLQKAFPFYSHCLLDLRPFLILSYECLFLLDFIGTCSIYVVVTFQRSLRDWLFTFRKCLEGLQSPLCFFQERHLVRTKANNSELNPLCGGGDSICFVASFPFPQPSQVLEPALLAGLVQKSLWAICG